MKFLVDAQLPRRLAHVLRGVGYDVLHTLDLPARNVTTDQEIIRIAIAEERIVITKDADFVESFILHRRPPKLLLITTGNISNPELEALFVAALPAIVAALTTNDYVELSRTALITHI
jgi:predicted nuclease of predicted toxin-antitoxin system